MRIVAAIIGSLILLPIAAFCVFGFMATFEPTNQPDVFMAFRIGYAVVGIGCVVGVVGIDCTMFPKAAGLPSVRALCNRRPIRSAGDQRRSAESLLAGSQMMEMRLWRASEHDVRAALEKDIREFGERSLFVKVAEDEYTLRWWTTS